MLLVDRTRLRHARLGDWDTHRDTITRLYWDEKMTLKEVMAIMEKEHSFHATAKMYKVRLKNWGLTKYMRSDKLRMVEHNNYIGGDVNLPVIRGRVLGSRRLIQQLNASKNTRTFELVPHDHSIFSNSPSLLYQPSSPKSWSDIENCIHAVRSYNNSRFEDKTWQPHRDRYRWSMDVAPSWFLDVCKAQELISARRGSAKAFQVLEECFNRYRSLLDCQNPSLLIVTFMAVLKFDGAGLSEIAISLLKYVAKLCVVSVGPTHPLSRIWGLLYAAGLDQLCQAAPAIMTANLDSIRANTGTGNRFLRIANMHMARELPKYTDISEQASNAEFTRLYQEMGGNIESKIDKAYFWCCKLFQGEMMIDNGHYTEAETFLKSIRADILNGGSYNRFTYYYHMGRTNVGLERYDAGVKCFSEALTIATDCVPHDLSARATILAGLLTSYRLLKDVKAVQDVKALIEKTREDIVQQIKAGQFFDIGVAEVQENMSIHMDYQLYRPTNEGGRWCRAGRFQEVEIAEAEEIMISQIDQKQQALEKEKP